VSAPTPQQRSWSMSRMVPIVKREFMQAVASKAFLIGTILGPLLLVGIFATQFLIIAKSGGGEQRIAIVDATDRGLGERVVAFVEERAAAAPAFMSRPAYEFEVETAAAEDRTAVESRLTERVLGKQLDGFLWIPPDALTGAGVHYEGTNATNSQVTGDLRQAVQRVVQSERLRQEGIDEARLGNALQPVAMEISRTGEEGGAAGLMAARMLAMGMAFAIYIMVIMYGQSIMTSVQEEKRDRIVELIVSSVRAKDLLFGKVVGIGAAGVLQLSIWVAAAALLITYGAVFAGGLGASESVVAAIQQGTLMPRIPLSLGLTFILYFAGGFFLFATLFAVVGALVTNMQEAQQFVFPILLPFIIGFFIAIPAGDNPNGTIAVIGSIVPFTSPMVMPARMAVASVDWLQIGASLALLFTTALLTIWLAAKIYRTAIFATGKKPTASEIIRWMRAA
jgi:ABC-2 type transport system permease protein